MTLLLLAEGRGKTKAKDEERIYSEHFACVDCGLSFGELEPRNFTFNSPHGACRDCTGLGVKMEIDPELVIPNSSLSIAEGAVVPWARTATVSTWYMRLLEALARKHGFSLNTPVKDLTPEQLDLVLYGDKGQITLQYTGAGGSTNRWDTTFEGVITNLTRRYKETDSDYVKTEIEKYMAEIPCPACEGARLKPESLAVTVDDRNISQVTHAVHRRGAELGGPAAGPGHAAHGARADDRHADPQGDPRAARRSCTTSASTT